MDYIEFGHGSHSQTKFGEGLAEMHLAEPEHKFFGFPVDGCCGACPQLNNSSCQTMSWVEFWKQYRLGSQLQMLKENHPEDHKIQEKGAELMAAFEGICFSDLVEIKPSLLHGDLWSGNFGFDKEGNPVIFDPSPYYGHNEADLGIARMFGGFNSSFWEGYHRKIPKTQNYEKRAMLYELHHHLNHYNIFGSGYRSGALSLMQRILDNKH